MDYFFSLIVAPAAWAALATLTLMEVVLGIDNLIFIPVKSRTLQERLYPDRSAN